eukprot:TRINITY_DN2260_c0_g1_i1.p1 TRINITY_DN2260_c0_g1~~TRINITY_DN2260_c0_g1_i1.p1  ORF type:complete len:432 (-),score=28.31 TRINITY_DN2260_c0_g1_i1:291-1463(-)
MVLLLWLFCFYFVYSQRLHCECGSYQKANQVVCGEDGLVYANECLAKCQGVSVVDLQYCQQEYGSYLQFSEKQDPNIQAHYLEKGFKYIGKLATSKEETSTNIWGQQSPLYKNSSGSLFITYEGEAFHLEGQQFSNIKISNNEGIYPQSYRGLKGRRLLQTDFELSILRGRDTRKQVGQELSSQYPLSTIGAFSNQECSGTLIDRHHVLTAAHCIFENGQTKTGLEFSPGQYGDIKPFGTIAWFGVQVPDEWLQNSDPAYDYAMVYLFEDVADQTGALGYDVDCDNELYNFNLAGYEWGQGFQPGTLYHSFCTSVELTCNNREFKHECDAGKTQQGSALWLYLPGGRSDGTDLFTIRGVHSRVADNQQENLGMTLVPQIVQTLNQWIMLN